MPLKRKFNLENLGTWVTGKKKKNNDSKANKENVCVHYHSENQLLTAENIHQIAPVTVIDSIDTPPVPYYTQELLREPTPSCQEYPSI